MSNTTTAPGGPGTTTSARGWPTAPTYLGRLQRCLAGEIAPDRHYFTTKARALRDASTGLLRRARDVERGLGSCDADYGSEGGTCALPAGHAGAHGDGPTPAERLAERATPSPRWPPRWPTPWPGPRWPSTPATTAPRSPTPWRSPPAAWASCAELPGSWPTRWPASQPAPDHIGSRAGPARLPVSLLLSPPEPPWDTGGRAGDRSHRFGLHPRRPAPVRKHASGPRTLLGTPRQARSTPSPQVTPGLRPPATTTRVRPFCSRGGRVRERLCVCLRRSDQ